jgi:hypothetical protein
MRRLLGLGLVLLACSSDPGVNDLGSGGVGSPTAGQAGSSGDGATSSGASSPVAGTNASAGTEAGGEGSGGTEPAAGGAGGAAGATVAGAAATEGGAPTGGTAGAGGTQLPQAGQAPTGGGGAAPCEPEVFYRDQDKDGFGDLAQTTSACTAPTGYVGNSDDCFDGNKDAHPEQTEWFTEHRGDGSFDYDCSGAEDLRWPSFSECPALDNSCPPPNTWPQGFSCDYLGMFEEYSEDEGWRRYQYSVCPPEPCSYASSTIPDCGQQGRVGKPPISWNAGSSQYLCEDEPVVHNVTMIGPLRTQACR